MFRSRTARAHPCLRQVVSSFVERRGDFSKLAIIRPLHARPDLIAEFYIREPYRVSSSGGAFTPAPESVLVGPTTRPGASLGAIGETEAFAIKFTPTGLTRLFGFPASLVVDQAIAPSDLLGKQLKPLEDDLRRARDFPARIAATESFLRRLLLDAPAYGAVDHGARLVARSRGRISIDTLAAHVDLSARQLQRRFLREVGVAPKFHARLYRFTAAIDARRDTPTRSWADIAVAHGYADQAHLGHEARQLADLTPNTLVAALAGVGVSDFYNR